MSTPFKRLYNGFGGCNTEHIDLHNEVRRALDPIITKWMADGFDGHDVEMAITELVHDAMSHQRLQRALKKGT